MSGSPPLSSSGTVWGGGGALMLSQGVGRAIWYQVSGLDCHHLFTLALVETPLLLLASGLWPTEPSDVRYNTVLVVNKTG